MLHCHRPQAGIGDIRPMNRGMEHHGSSDRHDCLNASFGNGVVVMCSSARKADHLLELGKLGSKLFGSECRTVVSQKGLHNYSQVSRHQLVVLLGFQRFMSGQVRLRFDVDVARSVIDE